MAVTVKKTVLWRKELKNRPGTLAESLKPFAENKVNLQVVMGYVLPGDERAALEVYPVRGKKAEAAAKAGGLSPFEDIHALVVEGDDRAGLAYELADAIARAGVNIRFAIFEVVGARYKGTFGFDSAAAAAKAADLIKEAEKARAPRKKAAAKKKAAPKRAAAKKPAARKAATKKGAAKKPAARKTAARKTAAKKATARKTTARKPVARMAAAKKPVSRKTATRKTAAKKPAARKATKRK